MSAPLAPLPSAEDYFQVLEDFKNVYTCKWKKYMRPYVQIVERG